MKSISVVIPAYASRDALPLVLRPLLAARSAGTLAEVLVVDDHSGDGTLEYCREQGVPVIRTDSRSGPARARNLGAGEVRGDVILFVDADVVVHDDVPQLVREVFESDATCVATFGSYDDAPPARDVVSQYMNLRHHYIHQRGEENATTFWAGCGAVDRGAFLRVGGFDAERFPRPAVEDIELATRLRPLGRIELRKSILCTHLKRWTLRSMLRSDVFGRALPWSRLLVEQELATRDLNLSWAERAKAALPALFVGAGIAVPLFPAALALVAATAVLMVLSNAGLFSLIGRRAGARAMLASVVLHQIYYVLGSATYGCVWMAHLPSRWRRARSTESM